MIKELADHIAENIPGDELTLGDNLHVGWRTEYAPDKCTTMQERVSALIDDSLPQQRQRAIQILTRAKGYHEAREECLRIVEFIRSLSGVSLSGWRIYTVSGVEPQYLGSDKNGRHEFSANLVLRTRKDT